MEKSVNLRTSDKIGMMQRYNRKYILEKNGDLMRRKAFIVYSNHIRYRRAILRLDKDLEST